MIPSNWPNRCETLRWWVRYGEMYLGKFFHMKPGKQRLQKISQKWELDGTPIVRKPKVIGTSHLEKTASESDLLLPNVPVASFLLEVSRIMNQKVEKRAPHKWRSKCWHSVGSKATFQRPTKSRIPTPKQFPRSLLILGADVLKLTFFDRSYPSYHMYPCLFQHSTALAIWKSCVKHPSPAVKNAWQCTI